MFKTPCMTTYAFLQFSEYKILIKKASTIEISEGFHYWSFTLKHCTLWRQDYAHSSVTTVITRIVGQQNVIKWCDRKHKIQVLLNYSRSYYSIRYCYLVSY